jgi:hypothetical protein
MRDGSAQRQRSWRTIKNTGIGAGECAEVLCNNTNARRANPRDPSTFREGSSQHVQGTALVMQIERTVMVVCVRIGDSRLYMRVFVHADRCRPVNIQRVVVEQRDDPRYLRNYKECQQRCAKPADCSHERHGLAIMGLQFALRSF